MAKNETTDIEVEVKHETDKAMLVTDGIVEAWTPKSQIEQRDSDGDNEILYIPTWLAKKAGFV